MPLNRQLALILALAATLLTTSAADTVYFPKGSEGWYSKPLEAMNEPSLIERRADKNVGRYRFLWLRSFHKPIAVRIQKNNSGVTLRVIRLSGAAGHAGNIEHDKTFTLTTNQWNDFLKLADKSSFWQMPSAEKYSGLDGSQWILEGQAAGKYHVVDRWTPGNETEERHLDQFVACCRYLLSLAKLEVPKNEDY